MLTGEMKLRATSVEGTDIALRSLKSLEQNMLDLTGEPARSEMVLSRSRRCLADTAPPNARATADERSQVVYANHLIADEADWQRESAWPESISNLCRARVFWSGNSIPLKCQTRSSICESMRAMRWCWQAAASRPVAQSIYLSTTWPSELVLTAGRSRMQRASSIRS